MTRKPIFLLNCNGLSQSGDSTVFIGGSASFSICWKGDGISFAMDRNSVQGMVKSPDLTWSKAFSDIAVTVNWEDFPCSQQLDLYKITETGEEQFASLDLSYTNDINYWKEYKENIHDKRGIFLIEQRDLLAAFTSGTTAEAFWELIVQKTNELDYLHNSGKMRNDEFEKFLAQFREFKYIVAVENLASENLAPEWRTKFLNAVVDYMNDLTLNN